jgi:hypothetical protein
MYLQKVISRKTLTKSLFFVGALKVNDENLSEAWIRTKMSCIRNTGLHKPRMKKYLEIKNLQTKVPYRSRYQKVLVRNYYLDEMSARISDRSDQSSRPAVSNTQGLEKKMISVRYWVTEAHFISLANNIVVGS